jgi:hypothetical protein
MFLFSQVEIYVLFNKNLPLHKWNDYVDADVHNCNDNKHLMAKSTAIIGRGL